jgi:hypothetical protein
MVSTKRLFIEITTLEPIEVDRVYLSLSKNFEKSFIEIFEVKDSYTYKDVRTS